MRRIRRLVLMVGVIGLTLGAPILPAWAHDQGSDMRAGATSQWYFYNADGRSSSCGLTSGWYVKSTQAWLWAARYLSSSSDIDGAFGPTTEAAAMAFQTAHGVSSTGCVATHTWDAAQNYRHYDRNLNIYYPHMTRVGSYGCPTGCVYQYNWREKSNQRYVRYEQIAGTCWSLIRITNQDTGSSVNFNHIVGHDGNNTCDIIN